MDPPVALTIAGSDSAAGAGMQADLKTFAARGVFGACAVTAVTAQSTAAVHGVHVIPTDFVEAQIDAVLGDLRVAAVKTGMLATSSTVRMVGRRAAGGDLPNLVVDPVLVASTGRPLLDDDGVAVYRDELLPHATVMTPNLREAAVLTGLTIADVDGMVAAATRLAELGRATVVVKGGHLDGSAAPDVVARDGAIHILSADRIPTANDHGTGCTLSAAIAAGLAAGGEVTDVIAAAKAYVAGAIAGAAGWRLGQGHGPLDHFGWTAAEGDSGPARTT